MTNLKQDGFNLEDSKYFNNPGLTNINTTGITNDPIRKALIEQLIKKDKISLDEALILLAQDVSTTTADKSDIPPLWICSDEKERHPLEIRYENIKKAEEREKMILFPDNTLGPIKRESHTIYEAPAWDAPEIANIHIVAELEMKDVPTKPKDQ